MGRDSLSGYDYVGAFHRGNGAPPVFQATLQTSAPNGARARRGARHTLHAGAKGNRGYAGLRRRLLLRGPGHASS